MFRVLLFCFLALLINLTPEVRGQGGSYDISAGVGGNWTSNFSEIATSKWGQGGNRIIKGAVAGFASNTNARLFAFSSGGGAGNYDPRGRSWITVGGNGSRISLEKVDGSQPGGFLELFDILSLTSNSAVIEVYADGRCDCDVANPGFLDNSRAFAWITIEAVDREGGNSRATANAFARPSKPNGTMLPSTLRINSKWTEGQPPIGGGQWSHAEATFSYEARVDAQTSNNSGVASAKLGIANLSPGLGPTDERDGMHFKSVKFEDGSTPEEAGYALSFSDGSSSPNLYALAESVSISQGSPAFAEQEIESLRFADNNDIVIRRNSTDVQSRTELTIDGDCKFENPATMRLVHKGSVFARTNVVQSMELFDYSTATWESVDSRNASRFVDVVSEVEITGDPSRFVEPGTKKMQARVAYTSDIARQNFTSYTDHFQWYFEPTVDAAD